MRGWGRGARTAGVVAAATARGWSAVGATGAARAVADPVPTQVAFTTSVVPSARGASNPVPMISSTSCPAVGSCVAVGMVRGPDASGQGLLETLSGGRWTDVQAPLPAGVTLSLPGFVVLSSVACTTVGQCTAVGQYTSTSSDGSPEGDLAVTGWGSSWTATTLPLPSDARATQAINGPPVVACAPGGPCVAAATYSTTDDDTSTFVDTLGGSTPTTASLPGLAQYTPVVACPSATACVVGSGTTLATGLGTTWGEAVPSPEVSSVTYVIAALSCPTAASCSAVASAGSSTTAAVAIAGAPGGPWTDAPITAPAGTTAPGVTVTGLSCATATSCALVGAGADGSQAVALTGSGSGTSWTLATAPVPSGATGTLSLDAVSCAPGGTCVAAGTLRANGATSPVLETGGPGGFTASMAPLPPSAVATASTADQLPTVSCPAVTHCVAVGMFSTGFDDDAPFAAVQSPAGWHATALGVPTAEPDATPLTAVTCPALGRCVAVGPTLIPFGEGPSAFTVETETAGGWVPTLVPPPSAAAWSVQSLPVVDGLACAGSGTCVGGGSYPVEPVGLPQALVLTEQARQWTASLAPLPPDATGTTSKVSAVACLAGGSCVAVGSYQAADGTEGFVDTENGGSWTSAEIPLPAGSASTGLVTTVQTIACGTSICVGGGRYLTSGGQVEALVVSGSPGGTWTAETVPAPTDAATAGQGPEFQLEGAACAGTDCVLSGSYDAAGGQRGVLVSGSPGAWTVLGDVGDGANMPVACPAAGSCMAVAEAGSPAVPTVESGFGGSWTAAPLPLPADASAGTSPTVAALACGTPTTCLVTGSYTRTTASGGAEGAGLLVAGSPGAWSASGTAELPGSGSSPATSLGAAACAPGSRGPSPCLAVGVFRTSGGEPFEPVVADDEPRITGLAAAGQAACCVITIPGDGLTVTGSSFSPDATVTFNGRIPAASVTYVSSTELDVTLPQLPTGTVSVAVTTGAGPSPAGPKDRFVYDPG